MSCSMSSGVSWIGGMSVSGYIRAAPGLGRMYRVVPSGFAARVSSGTPSIASRALRPIAFSASVAFSSVSATKTTASSGSRFVNWSSWSSSSLVMP